MAQERYLMGVSGSPHFIWVGIWGVVTAVKQGQQEALIWGAVKQPLLKTPQCGATPSPSATALRVSAPVRDPVFGGK